MSIDELLSQPEGKTIEFKRDLSSPKPMNNSTENGGPEKG